MFICVLFPCSLLLSGCVVQVGLQTSTQMIHVYVQRFAPAPNPWVALVCPLKITSLVQIRGLECLYKDVRTITVNTDMEIACSTAWQWVSFVQKNGDFTTLRELLREREREKTCTTKKWTSKPSVAVVLPTHLKSPFVSIKSLKDV